ncbi:ABC transporter permease [Rubrimonas sp.]|uniref:ABC transporter permease n=1 Tax=Rubrimonas sp. TaxID=2036015 RepID=UPI002FDDFF84
MLVLRKFLRDLPAVVGLFIIGAAVLIALFGDPLLVDAADATRPDLRARLTPPNWDKPFGTDNLGRDIFTRVVMGTGGALTVALTVVAAAMAVGIPLGLYAGYTDGWASEGIMRITDIFLAVPQLILAIALAQIIGRGMDAAMAALAVTYWPFFTRTVYGETRRVRTMLFIEALEGLGAARWRILALHVLPNVAAPVIVRATIGMGFIILTTAVLGFLGVGAAPPSPDWGLAIAEGRRFMPDHWWMTAFPGLAILVLVLGFNLLGDGLRDLVDPRLRRSR